MYVFLNDTIVPDTSPLISIQDRGFLLADGLFETFKIIDSKPLYLHEHLNRLFYGAQVLGIIHKITLDVISKAIDDLMEINQFSESVLSARLTLTRGVGPRGILPPTEILPTVMLTITPYLEPPDHPWKLCIASNRRNEYSILSNIKSLAYTDNILAKIEAEKMGADDALFLNTQGNVACTSCANIFIIKNNVLITPPISDGVLPGVTRARVIAESALPVEERSITLDECRAVEEIFVTNSLMGIKTATLKKLLHR